MATGGVTIAGGVTYVTAGSAVTPGGSNGQIQYNNNGAFGGVPGFSTDGSGNIFTTQQFTASGPTIKQSRITANTGSAYTVNPVNGYYFDLTVNAGTTITLAATEASTEAQQIVVKLTQDGVGSHTVSFSGVVWEAGIAPVIPATAGTAFTISFEVSSSEIRGFYSLQSTDAITVGSIVVNGITTANGGLVNKVRVFTGSGAVAITSVDNIVVVNKASGAATTVNLPAASTGTTFVVKDGKGDAATNNITVTPAAGTIDGSSTFVMNTNFQSVTLVYNGTQWNKI